MGVRGKWLGKNGIGPADEKAESLLNGQPKTATTAFTGGWFNRIFGSSWGRAMLAAVVSLTWMCFSSALIFMNKHLMSNDNFHYPITLSGLGMAFSSVASFIVCRVFKLVEVKQKLTWRFWLTRIMPVGFCMALTLAFGNLVYLYLKVTFIQILKAFTPVITMVVAFSAGVERPSLRLVGSVLFIAGGVAVASYGEVNFNVLGVIIMFASEFTESIRLILTQLLLQGCKFSAIEGLMHMAPACVLWLSLMSYFMEYDAMVAENALGKVLANPYMYTCAAAMGFMVNLFAYLTVQLGGALTLKVLGNVKNAMVVWGGVLLFNEHVSFLSLAGYGISIGGFLFYQQLKMQSITAAKQPDKIDTKHSGEFDPEAPLDHSPIKAPGKHAE